MGKEKMRIMKKNYYHSLLLAGVLTVGWQLGLSTAQGFELVVEDFDGYGIDPVSIHGKEGGDGWTSPWIGRSDLESYLPVNMPGPQNTRFVNRGGESGENGAMGITSQELTSFKRSFGEEPISSPIWLGFLAYSASVDSVTDTNLIEFRGQNGTAFFVGHRKGKVGIYSPDGKALAETESDFPQGGRGNVIIARIDSKVGVVRVWLNPSDLSATDSLASGDHAAEAKIDLGGAIEPTLAVFLRENKANKVMIDALRLAYGDEEEDVFEAIVNGAKP